MEKRMISKKGCRIMLAAAAVLVLMAAFITYQVGAVYDTEPLPLDLAVQKAFFSLRSQILNPIVILITHLSDTVTIIAFCAILLVMPNRKQYGVPLSLAALGGLAFYKPMKHIFLRARPDTALHLVTQGGYSFPSGHSVTSAIFYGLLIYLLNRHCKNEKLKKILGAVCGFLALAIGPSRIYVGVHWPTDVLAGWCIGGAVLLVSICILERIYDGAHS
ncbi:MAG: phosphatase PAP2 family protein [Firmicutes bacterium]|nr:phosphatase PAP2 family protein [Bacillota bacterium]